MKKKLVLSILVTIVILCLVISPQKYISITNNAIEIWAKVLLPALFPFFIFTRLLTSIGCVQNASLIFKNSTYKLYKTPPISGYAFFISILSGYPVGSKLVSDLYESGQISKLEAKKTLTFTSNSGPMFILGSVGIGMLKNQKIGFILLFSHILGAIFNGLLYRNIKGENTYKKSRNFSTNSGDLTLSVNNSITSILTVGGMVVVAFIIIEILNSFNIFFPIIFILSKIGLNQNITTGIIDGFFEITKGCLSVCSLDIIPILKTTILSFIISFGGLCTTLQAMVFLQEITTYKFFILQKITHAILSCCVCILLCVIFGI